MTIKQSLKYCVAASFAAATLFTTMAQTKLPAPAHLADGISLERALQLRKSIRNFDSAQTIDSTTMSNLLWAAAGINRPDGHRTNPTAMNTQEIDIYVFTPQGVSLYDFREHALRPVVDGDYRALVAGTAAFSQDFVLQAPVSLVLVADLSRFERASDRNLLMAMADAGIVSQNINLFCAASGLGTVTRATMDADGIRQLLGLDSSCVALLNNPVGYLSQK
ncbi:MAG: SagB/ThcOx family dehydrogenase [Muribaculaceae bacterium]|nr:SagB/ThcOx family dehydrogenase [Muribaculaceae bacterium]MDE6611977.1 SagB/ThcOx family dehydrogenase [Muribaculaceae bacterium]